MGVPTRMQARFLRHLHHHICTLSVSSQAGMKLDLPTSRHAKMYTLTSLIKACGAQKDLSRGKKLHADAREEGLASHAFVASAIVCMYGKCGDMLEAEDAFRAVSEPDVVLCNALLAAYLKLEEGEKTLFLFHQMNAGGIAADCLTYVNVIQACGLLVHKEKLQSIGGQSIRQRCLEVGRALHSEANRKGFTADARVNTALVCMYAKCHTLSEAENVFSMSAGSVVAWNAILSAYMEKGHIEICLWLYRQMEICGINPDHITIVFALQACRILAEKEGASLVLLNSNKDASLEIGRALHAVARSKGLVGSVYVGTTLINVYGKCSSTSDAEEVFCAMSRRTVVTWNAMLSGYIELGHSEKALLLYRQMREEGVTPDQQSIVSALHACGNLMKKERTLSRGGTSLLTITEMGHCFHAVVRNALGFAL
ncbi:hypothetical protein GOP47_0024151 [Adiantum capillus-veneris]|uniref:Pentatricopeptide repeat-containing protein n=1 Tax=Adiantum capillus-veneris TaxID=13818 RepID=A0A9D4Z6L8_ADICA|nr:hypothetical protein GOP47_0024151 [Adiantum capillus-veneris]